MIRSLVYNNSVESRDEGKENELDEKHKGGRIRSTFDIYNVKCKQDRSRIMFAELPVYVV